MSKTPDDLRQLAKEAAVKVVDLKFTDLIGVWQHFSIPVEDLDDDLFVEGIGFDGSSIRGFQMIHESDMLPIPDPETACVDPILEVPTMNLICNLLDPVTLQRLQPRSPLYCTEGGKPPEEYGDCRGELLGAGTGVLHL